MNSYTGIFLYLAFWPAMAAAGIDQPWNDLRYDLPRVGLNELSQGIFIYVLVAFFVRLIEKGDFGPFVAMIVQGVWMLVSMYFWLALVLFGLILTSKLFQGFGLGKNISGLFALPIAVYLVWRLFCFVGDRKGAKTEKRR